MKPQNALKSIVPACLLIFCLFACSDEDNPIQPNDPPKVDSTDTIRIDSIDAHTICPPQEITVYGHGFSLDRQQVKVQIGGQESKITSLNENSISVVVPWNIQDGKIELRDSDDHILASITAAIDIDCDVNRPEQLNITSIEPLEYCRKKTSWSMAEI